MSTSKSLWLVTAAYVIAIGVGAGWLYYGPPTGRLWLDAFIADVLGTLVIFGASIPMMEARNLERRPQYQDVIDRVPRFVPGPPRRSSGKASA
jgi:hypothetical protein